MIEEGRDKRKYKRKTKWYAVKIIWESDSKTDAQNRLLLENPDELPEIIRGSKIEAKKKNILVF